MKVTILFWKLMEKQPNGSINIREKGYLGEFSIAGGTNYKDKLYLGAVLGIQWTYDKQRILYSEIAEENTPSLLVFYEFRQYRRTRVRGSI